MLKPAYQEAIKKTIQPELPEETRLFIFGSSASDENFNDVDIGIISKNELPDNQIMKVKEKLENTTFPYKFDIIDFNKVEKEFKDKVLKEKILWLT